MKLGRLAAGMATEVKKVTGEMKATLEVEWEVAIKKVYGPKAVGAVVDAEVVSPPALPAATGGEAKP